MKNIKIISLLAVLLLSATAAQGQNKVMQVHSGGNVVYAANTSQVDSITFKKPCENIDPLTDLLWLKDKIDEIIFVIQNVNPNAYMEIYQYVYNNGEIGFMVNTDFYNCAGEMLCMLGGFTGGGLALN